MWIIFDLKNRDLVARSIYWFDQHLSDSIQAASSHQYILDCITMLGVTVEFREFEL